MKTLSNPLARIATLTAATVAVVGLTATQAKAADPILGALIGGGIGAAIGDSTHHRNGAAVGGVLGAIVGSSIAADSNRYYYDNRGYYDRGYYDRGYYNRGYSGAYYAPAPVYVAPRYYAPPTYGYYAPPPAVTFVYSSGSRRHHGAHRHYRHDRRW